jgi:hypothetical protein
MLHAGDGASGGGVKLMTFVNDVDHLTRLAHVNPIKARITLGVTC